MAGNDTKVKDSEDDEPLLHVGARKLEMYEVEIEFPNGATTAWIGETLNDACQEMVDAMGLHGWDHTALEDVVKVAGGDWDEIEL